MTRLTQHQNYSQVIQEINCQFGAQKVVVYLDYNASAPIRPEVADSINLAINRCGNPSSIHEAGRIARQEVEKARAAVASLVSGNSRSVTFTSGATEANNQILVGTAEKNQSIDVIITSSIEHPSLLIPATTASIPCRLVPVGNEGTIDLNVLADLLAQHEGRALVSIMWANNETGVIQPIEEAAELAHRFGALFHSDAAQAVGKIPVDMARTGVDALSISAHKLGGATGVGAVVVRPGIDLKPLIRGGGQENRLRAGTENVPGIVGFGTAAALAKSDIVESSSISSLRNRMEAAISSIGGGDITVHGKRSPRLPNTSCISTRLIRSETQVIALDLAGCAVSSGAACSSGKVERSHVLTSMGLPESKVKTAIRISLGWGTTQEDVDQLVGAWSKMYRRVVHSSAA